MSKRYFVQRFHYTLKLLNYQWNMTSKKHLKLNNIKTTYNKASKENYKLLKKLTGHVCIVKTEQMARHSLKS